MTIRHAYPLNERRVHDREDGGDLFGVAPKVLPQGIPHLNAEHILASRRDASHGADSASGAGSTVAAVNARNPLGAGCGVSTIAAGAAVSAGPEEGAGASVDAARAAATAAPLPKRERRAISCGVGMVTPYEAFEKGSGLVS